MAIVGVFGDIHGNITALDAALSDMDGKVDRYICLGDYASELADEECVQRVMRLSEKGILKSVYGNHDEMALKGYLDSKLSPESMSFLQDLPMSICEYGIHFTHANPLERSRQGKGVWLQGGEYIDTLTKAQIVFEECEHQIIAVGHTHKPVVYTEDELISPVNNPVQLNGDRRFIINPGAVGYSRVSDSSVNYGLLDTDSMAFEVRNVLLEGRDKVA